MKSPPFLKGDLGGFFAGQEIRNASEWSVVSSANCGSVLFCLHHTDAPFSILASKLIAIDTGFAKAIEIAFL